MTLPQRLPRSLLLGVFFVAMAMLLQEITLTRIFSVTMFYHFAFMVVSITLFGMGVSGIYVYLNPQRFQPEKAGNQMTLAATLFAISVPVSYILQRSLPSAPDSPSFGFLYLSLTYILVAIPFFLGGITLSLALTHFSSGVAVLYFADLLGASIGCALVFPALSFLTGPDIIALVGVLGALSALAFSGMAKGPAPRRRALAALVVLVALLGVNTTRVFRVLNTGTLNLRHPGTQELMQPIDIDWNPMSRVIAYHGSTRPSYWPGTSPDSVFYPTGQVLFLIDKSAMTWAVAFDGDYSKVGWIYSDLSVLPLFLKKDAAPRVLDIGSGGGQHALAALGLGAKDVTCVEINPTVLNWTKTRFADLTGNIYNRPNVKAHLGDGRTFVARSKETYDVISFVSSTTFTATTSGAFMMAENNLFTVEAFDSYYDHLSPDGIMAVSQVMTRDYSGLLLRIVSLGRNLLEKRGVTRPADHLLVLMKKTEGYGIVLVKKSPFTAAELDLTDSLATEMSWVVLHSPRTNNDPQFHDLLTAPSLDAFVKTVPLNLFPPTDDRPFFFNLVPFTRLGSAQVGSYDLKYGKVPAQILLNLFFIVIVLTLLFLIVPLILARRARIEHRPGTLATLGFFVMIGLGFIMVEVPLMQRFVLFLGHPVYAISVVLFSILLFSGIGSFITRGLTAATALRWLKISVPALLVLLVLYSLSLHSIFLAAQEASQGVKVVVSVLLLLPLGILMGMPFPAMIRRTAEFSPGLVPWCWGVNGATSVLGSVSGVIVALTSGFTASLVIGAAAYAGALVCVWLLRDDQSARADTPVAREVPALV